MEPKNNTRGFMQQALLGLWGIGNISRDTAVERVDIVSFGPFGVWNNTLRNAGVLAA
jgi:hypothetical protein